MKIEELRSGDVIKHIFSNEIMIVLYAKTNQIGVLHFIGDRYPSSFRYPPNTKVEYWWVVL